MHHGACTWYGILTRCSLSWSLGSTRTPVCTVHTELNSPVQHLYGQRDTDGGVEAGQRRGTVIYAAMERIEEAGSDPVRADASW